jgi:hypothetical protein
MRAPRAECTGFSLTTIPYQVKASLLANKVCFEASNSRNDACRIVEAEANTCGLPAASSARPRGMPFAVERGVLAQPGF